MLWAGAREKAGRKAGRKATASWMATRNRRALAKPVTVSLVVVLVCVWMRERYLVYLYIALKI